MLGRVLFHGEVKNKLAKIYSRKTGPISMVEGQFKFVQMKGHTL